MTLCESHDVLLCDLGFAIECLDGVRPLFTIDECIDHLHSAEIVVLEAALLVELLFGEY